jgi:photosystem II stability/assembly factor-like uncharacterized protein
MQTNISRQVLSIFTALALLAALAVTATYAARSRSVVVEIPFDFQVSGKSFSAGRYLVERSTQASAEGLSLRSVNDNRGVFVLTSRLQSNWRQAESRLVFSRYHDQYFLSEFWTSGEESGRALIKSDKERRLQNEIAKSGAKAERIAVVVSQR